MKICVTSKEGGLDSEVDSRFGRCRYFVVVDTDSGQFEAVENANISAAGGAGIQSGQLMAGQGVRVLLTGNIGPNAFETLKAAHIDVITGVSGTVREAVEKYKRGEYKIVQAPSVDSKHGA